MELIHIEGFPGSVLLYAEAATQKLLCITHVHVDIDINKTISTNTSPAISVFQSKSTKKKHFDI